MIRIILVSFGQSFKYLHDACVNSIEQNLSGCELIDIETDYPKNIRGIAPRFMENTVKLDLWLDHMIDGEDNVFIDADTVILNDFSEVFDNPFDVCFTKRNKASSRLPFNSGVLFARSKSFVQEWAMINRKMMHNKSLWRLYNRKYIGYNQASFGWMLENRHMNYNIKSIPSYIYNNCDPYDWLNNIEEAKILHVKGELRKDLPYKAKFAEAVGIWEKYCKL